LVVSGGHGSSVPSDRQKSREISFGDPNDPIDAVRNEEPVLYPAPYSSRGDDEAVGDLLDGVKFRPLAAANRPEVQVISRLISC
jgi:hypothetical protein